jgi:hypothetical protein
MARFGHTITPIGKDKAILFGGAVGDTGTYSSTKANTSSQETLLYATTIIRDGKNSNLKETHPQTELHMPPSVSITISLFTEVLSEVHFFIKIRWLTG